MFIKPTEKTFEVTIENIGTFTFKYPNLRDDLRSEAIASQLLSGNPQPSTYAKNVSVMVAALSLQTVKAPDGWDLDNSDDYPSIERVYDAFISQVNQFRSRHYARDQESGAEGVQEHKVLVPAEV